MAKELSEDTGFTVSIKTLGGIAVLIATIVGMWFALQADIMMQTETTLKEVQTKINKILMDTF